MRHALDVLAEVAPDWLLEHMDAEWAERYRKRFSDFRLLKMPRNGWRWPKQLGQMVVGS